MKLLLKIPFIFYPILLFSILTLPFIINVPMLDGNIDAIQAHHTYIGGFKYNLSNNVSLHPPLKTITLSTLYHIFGPKIMILNLLGYCLGILAIFSIHKIGKALGNENTGRMASLIFAIYPMFVANVIFSPTDYLLTCILLYTILAYKAEKKLLFSFLLILLVLTKETGLLAISLFFIIDAIHSIKKIPKIIIYYVPALTIYLLWTVYLYMHGQGEWSDHLFTETASRGTIYTIFYNLTHFKIFNSYAASHGQQLLFLNYNWVLFTISLYLTIYYLIFQKNKTHIIRHFAKNVQKLKTVVFMFLFSIGYYLTVLTLQTYAIPRYALPITPFLLIWFCASLLIIKNIFIRTTIFISIFLLLFVGLFTSIDPIPTFLWGKTNVLGQNIYATTQRSAGNDGITYNMQFLFITSDRTRLLKSSQEISLSDEDCFWLLPNRVNDDVTLAILELDRKPNVIKCREVIPY